MINNKGPTQLPEEVELYYIEYVYLPSWQKHSKKRKKETHKHKQNKSNNKHLTVTDD